MPSIKTIAQHAGVSTATVSRVLNNSPTVKEKNRVKVLNSMKALDYRPNLQARALRTRRSNNIIVLIPTIQNPFFVEILQGILEEAKKSSYSVIIGTIEGNLQHVDPYIAMLYSRQADGIIFLSTTFDRAILDKIDRQYPYVLCNELLPGTQAPCITIDNAKAGFDAASYLLGQGCREIAFVAGRTSSYSTAQRLLGYRQALETNGLIYLEDHVIYGSNADIRNASTVIQFMKKRPFDGFIVNSDVKAALVLKTLSEDASMPGRRPHIVAFDGTYLSEVTIPSLTTVSQPMHRIGKKAASLLLAHLRTGKPLAARTHVLPHQITVRGT